MFMLSSNEWGLWAAEFSNWGANQSSPSGLASHHRIISGPDSGLPQWLKVPGRPGFGISKGGVCGQAIPLERILMKHKRHSYNRGGDWDCQGELGLLTPAHHEALLTRLWQSLHTILIPWYSPKGKYRCCPSFGHWVMINKSRNRDRGTKFFLNRFYFSKYDHLRNPIWHIFLLTFQW